MRSLSEILESLTPALASQIRACAAAFGMSPADRARVSAPPPSPDGDIAAKYFEPSEK